MTRKNLLKSTIVSQKTLKTIYTLQEDFNRYKQALEAVSEKLNDLKAKVLDQIRYGAQVEDGPFAAIVRDKIVPRRVSWKEEYISVKGEEAARKLVESVPKETKLDLEVHKKL